MNFQPIRFDPHTMAQYVALFAGCFPGVAKFTPDYLRWLYLDNPDGRALGFDAWDGERLAAHYVCVAARARLDGETVPVLLSLNTATAPAYQGRGLFTQLAEMSFEAARAAGFAGVYGVANANSTPGFIRKLRFQLVRQLEAQIGVGGLRVARAPDAAPPAFERVWSPASLAWRCAGPLQAVRCRARGELWQFEAPAVGRWLSAYAELGAAGLAPPAPAPHAGPSPLRLFIGLAPDSARRWRAYAGIPQRLRPSPLNLIYRSFAGGAAPLDAARIHFSFLDFDAY